MDFTATGLGTGLDISGIVERLVEAERAPTGNRLNIQEVRANTELSALGQFKSSLTSFQDALENLSKIENFQKRQVIVSDDTFLSASATSLAVPGSYQVEVSSLASTQKLASGAFLDGNTPVGTGNLTLTVNGQSTNIAIAAPANTLVDIRDAINDAVDNPGVRATIVNAEDGARLIVTSVNTGVDAAVGITTSGGDGGLAALIWDPATSTGAMTELQAAADAEALIDGFTITSSTNVIVGAIEGVTINLLEAEPGTLVDLDVRFDESAATQSVNTFIDAYNNLVETISTLTSFNVETNVGAPLLGDVTTRNIKSQLRREISGFVPDTGADFKALADIGITTSADGTLELDADKLSAAIASDFDAVGKLFGNTDTGIAVRMSAVLEPVLDTDGAITTREDTLKERLDRVEDRREALDLRMESVRERLLRQFNAMDALVSQLNNTSSFLTTQLANLPTFSNSRNS